MPRPAFVTVQEIADERKVTRMAILQAISHGNLRAFKGAGGRWLVTREEALRYLETPVKGRD